MTVAQVWRTVEVGAEVGDQFGGVRPDAVDEARLAAAQERQAEEVQAGDGADAAVVDDPPRRSNAASSSHG